MEKKNKAAKAVNTALGLIIIIAVILFSPLFGFAMGVATPEQRAASTVPAQAQLSAPVPEAAATPRPTPQPTPTPVVLPSAPPAPDPTPVPTPRPVAVQQPVQQAAPQQAAQSAPQSWVPEEYWEGEESYEEEGGGEEAAEAPAESYNYEGLGEQAENGVIATGSADIVFNTDMGGGDSYVPQTTVETTVDYGGSVSTDSSEGEAFNIG